MLYFLEIPPGDAGNFIAREYEIYPVNDDLYLLESYLEHKVGKNNTEQERWALAAECNKPESVLKD